MNEHLTEKLFQAVLSVEKNMERHSVALETIMNELKEIKVDRVNDLTKHDERVKDLERTVHERAKTQWPVIFGTVGAATAFLGMIGAIVAYAWVGDIQDLNKNYFSLRNDMQAHTRSHGHPEAVIEKIEGFAEHTDKRFDLLTDRINRIEERTKVLFKDGKAY